MIWSRSAFQSTQPEWAATRRWTAMTAISRYFNPRSPNGLRPAASTRSCELSAFQSTQPEWAATTPASFASCDCEFQSTQPEWAATMMRTTKKAAAKLFQSTQPEWAATRAPAWCDRHAGQISIHAARMGCDSKAIAQRDTEIEFQSTQPEWAATGSSPAMDGPLVFQSTQPEWAATHS